MSEGGSSDSAGRGMNLAGLSPTLTLKLTESDFEVKLHRYVLATCSGFFKATTGSFAEASSHEITLHEDDLDTLKQMLEYRYKGDYTYGACVGSSIRGQYLAYPWAAKSLPPVPPATEVSTSTSNTATDSAATWNPVEQGAEIQGEIYPAIVDEVIEYHSQMFDIADKYEVYGLQKFVAKKLAMLVNSHCNTGWVGCTHTAARTVRMERFIDLLIEIGHVSAQYPNVPRRPLIDAWIRHGGHMDCCAERRARLKIAFDADSGLATETIFATLAASPPRRDFGPSRWDHSTGRSCSGRCATCIGPQTSPWLRQDHAWEGT